MASCTFFGHRLAPVDIEPQLQEVLADLVTNEKVDTFYVGTNGNFDFLVRRNLKRLKLLYPHIKYFAVLAYLPKEKSYSVDYDYSDTIYPEGIEKGPPRFAICRRNEWMLKRSDFVVTYVTHTSGGAVKYKERAEKRGKRVINLR